MTISAFDIYIISLADNVCSVAGVGSCFTLFSFLILFVLFAVHPNDTDDEIKERKMIETWSVRMLACFMVTLSLYVLVPSSKTIAAMYLVPAVVNNEHVQNSAGNALEALEELTKQWMRDMIDKKQSAKKQEKNI